MTILHFMESAFGEKVLENPDFFVENGHEHLWEEYAAEVGMGLKLAGRLEDPTPKEVPSSMYGDLFQEWSIAVIGRNARNRAKRLRALGWEAREKSTFDSLVSDEISILLAEKGDFQGYGKAVAS